MTEADTRHVNPKNGNECKIKRIIELKNKKQKTTNKQIGCLYAADFDVTMGDELLI